MVRPTPTGRCVHCQAVSGKKALLCRVCGKDYGLRERYRVDPYEWADETLPVIAARIRKYAAVVAAGGRLFE